MCHTIKTHPGCCKSPVRQVILLKEERFIVGTITKLELKENTRGILQQLNELIQNYPERPFEDLVQQIAEEYCVQIDIEKKSEDPKVFPRKTEIELLITTK